MCYWTEIYWTLSIPLCFLKLRRFGSCCAFFNISWTGQIFSSCNVPYRVGSIICMLKQAEPHFEALCVFNPDTQWRLYSPVSFYIKDLSKQNIHSVSRLGKMSQRGEVNYKLLYVPYFSGIQPGVRVPPWVSKCT